MHLVIVAVLIHIYAIEGIDVSSQFRSDIPVDEVFLVDIGAVAFHGVAEVVGGHGLLETLDPLSDGDAAVDGEAFVLGILDAVHDAVARGSDEGLLLGVFIDHLQQPAVVLVDLDALLMHLHLVADLIGAGVAAVHIEVDELGRWTEFHSHEAAQVVGQGIPDHRLVAVVGQQSPASGVRKIIAQESMLLLELHTVGLFVAVPPRGVAAPANLGTIIPFGLIAIYIDEAAVDVGFLAGNSLTVLGLDVDCGHVSLLDI